MKKNIAVKVTQNRNLKNLLRKLLFKCDFKETNIFFSNITRNYLSNAHACWCSRIFKCRRKRKLNFIVRQLERLSQCRGDHMLARGGNLWGLWAGINDMLQTVLIGGGWSRGEGGGGRGGGTDLIDDDWHHKVIGCHLQTKG